MQVPFSDARLHVDKYRAVCAPVCEPREAASFDSNNDSRPSQQPPPPQKPVPSQATGLSLYIPFDCSNCNGH